jgi:1-acyl-sn-glycerol-3-phosphate acyltransferase
MQDVKIFFRDIEKWSLGNVLLKLFVEFGHDLFFYKRVKYVGLKNIPKTGSVILAPNHQNAIMDALTILFARNWFVVFLARADMFKKATLAKILRFFKIMPVYRIRDGKDSLQNNEIIFEKSIQILKDHGVMCIFPEASHVGKRILRPLTQGITKIAFQAQMQSKLPVYIIPTGVNYSNYFNFRSEVMVCFGDPIKVSDYMDIYTENSKLATQAILTKISEGIEALIVKIPDDEYYDTYEKLCEIHYNTVLKDSGRKRHIIENKVFANQKTVEIVNKLREKDTAIMISLKEKVSTYFQHLASINLRDWVLEKNQSFLSNIIKSLLLIIGFPLFLYGFIHNFIPFKIPTLATKNIKDRNFHSSLHFIIGHFLAFFYYIILFFVSVLISRSYLAGLAYLLSLPLSGIFAFEYYKWFIKLKACWRFHFRRNWDDDVLKSLMQTRNEIIEMISPFNSN